VSRVENLPEPRQPGRGYRWKTFEPGHEQSLKHGADSERKLRPIVDELVDGLVAMAPWCAAPVFEPAVQAWAWAEAQCVLYRRYFAAHGVGEDGEEPPASLDRWDRTEKRVQALRTELGLSPSSFTKLLRGLSAVDGPAAVAGIDALRDTGAALRQAADRLQLSAPADEGDEVEDGAA
jgi:hypothetical protein